MKATLKLSTLALAIASLSTISSVNAEEIDSVSAMLSNGKTDLSFRYRYEYVDQDGINKTAGASTLLTRLSYKSAAYNGFGFKVEMDDVTVIGDANYNSVVNGNTEYPVVADPAGTDVNQALLSYTSEDFSSALGRQRINHSAQRFIGGVAWRQNEQTYDAFRFKLPGNELFSADYAYISKVSRIFGPEGSAAQSDTWESDSHIFIANFIPAKSHTLSGFVYALDFEDAAANSSTTYGLEYKGKIGIVSLAASYATQSDNADNPVSYDADYMAAEIGLNLAPVNVSLGYELLGSDDGVAAFRTPLATLHKFQGWADKFLGTPATGIEDTYLKVGGKIGKAKLAVIYHQFDSDEGSIDYGSEIDAVVTYPVNKNLTAQLKYAAYNAEDFSVDTDKIWLTMNFKF
ncbi:MAG: hypothetical protein ACI90U_001585 [Pseudomonadales bacterium]|jgi:hypothetical protein